jgi:hypothetical protein
MYRIIQDSRIVGYAATLAYAVLLFNSAGDGATLIDPVGNILYSP